MPEFDDERLFSALRDYVRAAEALDADGATGDPRRTMDLAEHKSLAGLALRRRLLELGWTPPPRREPRAVDASSGQAPPPASGQDVTPG